MKNYQKLYYRLTAYVPRALPQTEEQYEHLKTVFLEAYEVPDSQMAWATIAGHLGSVHSQKIRYPWGLIANAAKRLEINKLFQDQKGKAIQALKDQFEKLQKESELTPEVKDAIAETIEDVS